MNVLVVVGTRPEAIKLAPVVESLRRDTSLKTRLALTGQHTDLVDSVLSTFDLEPDYDLEIMREGQSLYDVAQRCLSGLGSVMDAADPDLILVQGDTATVLFASMAGFFEQVRVGHVEAGLRSRDKWSPFPEEMFRRLSDAIADLHFAPTPRARENLRDEGIDEESIHVTGNTVVDALHRLVPAPDRIEHPILRELIENSARFVLVTAHRRESFGEPLRRVLATVRALADRYPEVRFLYPVHPNPEVRDPAVDVLSGHPGIHLVEPLEYFDLLQALASAELVLTDSGGIQEEAPSFGTPVLVLRDTTERPEGIEAGVAQLVGTDSEHIYRETSTLLDDVGARRSMIGDVNPYGDGHAAERIADIVEAALHDRPRRTEDWPGMRQHEERTLRKPAVHISQ